MIYLDYNATAPILPAVRDVMAALGSAPLNPSSIHGPGRHAKRLLEDARAQIASALSAFPNEVLFVGSGSEANNMVLRAFAPTHRLLVSAVEHASISKTASLLGAATVPVDANGVVQLDVLEQMLAQLTQPQNPSSPRGEGAKVLLSVMLAQNETGVIQPIAEIARIARAHGALVHCDAVQALGKTQLDWGLLGVDMLTISGHKAGGPVGAAALLIRNDLPIKSLITGGGQELGRRAGTENVPAIVGFAEAVKHTIHCPQAAEWREWQAWLETELLTAAPDAVVMGSSAPRLPLPPGEATRLSEQRELSRSGEGIVPPSVPCPHPDSQPNAGGVWANPTSPGGRGIPRLPQTICITMPGVKAETQLMHFDLAGFAVSAGSACSSGRVVISPALTAMGVADAVAETALRISWGWGTTFEEIQSFASAWKAAYAKLAKPKAPKGHVA